MWFTNVLIALLFLSVTLWTCPLCFDSILRTVSSSSTYDDSSSFNLYDAQSLYNDSTLPEVLLVSAFFPVSNTVHHMREYRKQLSAFLGHITTDVYIFTAPAHESLVRNLRGDLPIIINTTFSSPFDIPLLKGFQFQYHAMPSLDTNPLRPHSSHEYALSNFRPFFVDEAATNMLDRGKAYDLVFWNDLASFRSRAHYYTSWPDRRRVKEIWEEGRALMTLSDEHNDGDDGSEALEHLDESGGERKNTDLMLFFPIHRMFRLSMKYWQDSLGPVDDDVSQGSFFGGSPQSLRWWRTTFYAYHDQYLSQGSFIGRASLIENALFLLFPDHIISVWANDPSAPAASTVLSDPETSDMRLDALSTRAQTGMLGNCGPQEQLYYQFFFSSPSSIHQMRQMWNRDASPLLPWNWSWGQRNNVIRGSCRITRVAWMKDLLARRFGQDWVSPAPGFGFNQ
ncbi:hypothetical protein AX16_006954 [Volvariella volvacea WC 439]|nr:hypothetical protein AX16_006954 [Volvariella volvacea WC 439]